MEVSRPFIYVIRKDPKTRWPGSFDYKTIQISTRTSRMICMGWFGSEDSAWVWIDKQLIKDLLPK